MVSHSISIYIRRANIIDNCSQIGDFRFDDQAILIIPTQNMNQIGLCQNLSFPVSVK